MAWSVEEKKGDTKRTGPRKVVEMRPSVEGASENSAGEEKAKNRPGRDLAGGMEMLELEFLLGVIENTKGDDKNDVSMRKLSFNEVLRREEQNTVDSHVLAVYAVDDRGFYSKNIQCEAMKELAKRTAQKIKESG